MLHKQQKILGGKSRNCRKPYAITGKGSCRLARPWCREMLLLAKIRNSSVTGSHSLTKGQDSLLLLISSANGDVAVHTGGGVWQCWLFWLGRIPIFTKSDFWHPCSSFPSLVYFQAFESSSLLIAAINPYKNEDNKWSRMASFALPLLTSLDLH